MDLAETIRDLCKRQAERLEASPHRCGCGARTYEAGERCPDCEQKHMECERHPVTRTLKHIPQDFRHEWVRLGNPAMLVAPDGRKRLKDPRAVTAVRNAISAGMTRLTFLGPTGAGKTLLATAALIAMVDRLRPTQGGRWVSALALQATPLEYGEAPEVDELIRMPGPVLVDDVGQEAVPTNGRSHVARVIFERHEAARPVLITTGLTPELIMQKYANPGLRRRLFEPRDTAVIHLQFTGKP